MLAILQCVRTERGSLSVNCERRIVWIYDLIVHFSFLFQGRLMDEKVFWTSCGFVFLGPWDVH